MITADVLDRRRQRAVHAWQSDAAALDGSVILVGAGLPIGIPGGQDQTYPFKVHPDYRWLTGRDDVASVLVFDPQEGWIDFAADVSEAERVWEGKQPRVLPGARSLSRFSEWLKQRTPRAIAVLGASVNGVIADPERSRRLGEQLLHARRPKDAAEIELIRRAIAATVRGFERAGELARPGVSERQIQIELEAALMSAGAEETGYGTLVGSGPNAAVLHFAPSGRVIREGEFVLVDAGGAIDGYTADVTRTFASSTLDGERQTLYDGVLQAQVRAIERCRPGLQWREMHTRTALDLADALTELGVVRGRSDAFVEREAIAMFFPHGVGHMVGLGVRDAGGRRPGAEPGRTCCGVTLRVDLSLEAGYLMTVEPGLYFIDALLQDSERRERFADCVDWSVVDRLLASGIGGVRIEDNILISENGPVNLTTAIPK